VAFAEGGAVGVVEDARKALRQGQDFAWTLPLVGALGPDGRRWSLRWVERCLRGLLPFTEVDDPVAVRDAIDALRLYEGCTPSQEEVWERSYQISWPRWYAARIAVCHLYRAWWYSRFQSNSQFVVAQEAALRLMLERTGRPAELSELLLHEYEEVVAEAGGAA
jgi:hypothetical protein